MLLVVVAVDDAVAGDDEDGAVVVMVEVVVTTAVAVFDATNGASSSSSFRCSDDFGFHRISRFERTDRKVRVDWSLLVPASRRRLGGRRSGSMRRLRK